MPVATKTISRGGAVPDRCRNVGLTARPRDISDILCAVQKFLFLAVLLVSAFVIASPASAQTEPAPQQEAPAAAPAQLSAAPPAQAPAPPQATAPVGPTIILDPAHGGWDTGARGEGIAEKDVVLRMAQIVRGELERRGYRVVVTRIDDSNPSYDDRAAIANARRDAIFISLHASSTGADGTVRAYYMRFASPAPAGATPAGAGNAKPAAGMAVWEEAQRPYVDASHRLADLIQGELAGAFSGSPPVAAAVPVRALRSVAAPAVAVEISSVATPTPEMLTASAAPLGAAIARALVAFRPMSAGGAK
jgi:N-acetylmuramoyl-L-alanine amidase